MPHYSRSAARGLTFIPWPALWTTIALLGALAAHSSPHPGLAYSEAAAVLGWVWFRQIAKRRSVDRRNGVLAQRQLLINGSEATSP